MGSAHGDPSAALPSREKKRKKTRARTHTHIHTHTRSDLYPSCTHVLCCASLPVLPSFSLCAPSVCVSASWALSSPSSPSAPPFFSDGGRARAGGFVIYFLVLLYLGKFTIRSRILLCFSLEFVLISVAPFWHIILDNEQVAVWLLYCSLFVMGARVRVCVPLSPLLFSFSKSLRPSHPLPFSSSSQFFQAA